MSVSYTFTRAVNDGVAPISKADVVTSGANQDVDEAIPANQTSLPLAFAFTKTKLQGIYMVSDQACTVKTNTTTGTDTISLLANMPYMWTISDSYFANPFAGNVTGLYITNVTACTLRIRSIVDPT